MAISRDNSKAGTGSSYSFTCTGSNLVLIAYQQGAQGGSDNLGNPTYGGVEMTKLSTLLPNANSRWIGVWYLINPATGSNTFAWGSNAVNSILVSYAGVKQTGFPDSYHNDTGTSSSITGTTTVVAENCWTVMGMAQTFVGGQWTGSNKVVEISDYSMAIFDSNGVVATGSRTLSASGTAMGGGAIAGGIILSIEPYIPPTSIKTVNGLAYASVKTVNGLAIASMKTINGLQ